MNSIKKTARIAGLLYLLVTACSILSMVAKNLIVPGDAVTSASNIMASEGLFRIGFMSDIIGQMIHVLLVLVLYKLLKPVNQNNALIMVILGLVGVPIAMLNMLNHVAALVLLGGANYLKAFTVDQLQALVMFFLDLLDHGFYIALYLGVFGYFPSAI